MSPSAPRPAAYAAALTTVYLVWGSTYLAMHYVVLGLPPFLAAAARFLVAGGVLYGWLRLRGAPRATWAEWKGGLLVGGLLLLGGNGGVMWAEQYVPSSLAAILIATVPLWVAILDPLFFRGPRPKPIAAFAVVLGFAGVAVLVGGPSSLGGARGAGVAALVLAAFLWATGTLVSGRVARPASSLQGAAVQMVAGGVALAVFGTLLGEWPRVHLDTVALSSYLGLAYLAVFGSVIAYSSYIWLLRNGSAAKATTYAYVNPLVAIVLGWAVAGEVLGLRTLFASLMILASVALLVTLRMRPAPLTAVSPAALPPSEEQPDMEPALPARPT